MQPWNPLVKGLAGMSPPFNESGVAMKPFLSAALWIFLYLAVVLTPLIILFLAHGLSLPPRPVRVDHHREFSLCHAGAPVLDCVESIRRRLHEVHHQGAGGLHPDGGRDTTRHASLCRRTLRLILS